MQTIRFLTFLGVVATFATAVWAGDEKPAGPAASAIDRLVAELGADDFRVREAASAELEAHGAAARPALEKALQTNPSPEVRWRAEQLLRRLAGGQERPLGAEGAPPRPEAPQAGQPEDPLARIRRWLSEFGRRRGDPFDEPFLRGPLSAPRRIEAPGLTLERTGPGMVELRVQRAKEDGSLTDDVFRGSSLRDILDRNPDLLKHAGMDALRRREAEHSWPGFEDFFERAFPGSRVAPFGGGHFGFSMSSGQGVEIQQDADGVTVRIKERDEKGEETTREYKGESLEAIKAKHPELREKLKGLGVQFRFGPPEIFWGNRARERLRPLPPTTPEPAPPQERERPRFGLVLVSPDEALASHLDLAPGEGALVAEVRPGTQAAALGFQRNDIVVKVNGVSVGLDRAAEQLAAAAASQTPLTVNVIRRGASVTLSR